MPSLLRLFHQIALHGHAWIGRSRTYKHRLGVGIALHSTRVISRVYRPTTNSVEEFSAFLGAAITRNFDLLFGEFIIVSKLFAGEDSSLSEDDDVLETLGPANDTRRAVGIARVVDEASCWIDWARKKEERDNKLSYECSCT